MFPLNLQYSMGESESMKGRVNEKVFKFRRLEYSVNIFILFWPTMFLGGGCVRYHLHFARMYLYLYFVCICMNLCNPCWPTMFLAGCCVRDHLYCFHFRPCPEPQCPHLPPYADHSHPPTFFILSHCLIVCL